MAKKYITDFIEVDKLIVDGVHIDPRKITTVHGWGDHRNAGYTTNASAQLTDAQIAAMGYIKTYTDTNTQLSDAQVGAMGYIKTYTDTNTQLSDAQIAAMGYIKTYVNTTYNFSGPNFTSRNSGNPIAVDSATSNTVGYTTSSSAAGYSDGGLFVAAYSSSWVSQIFSNFRTGEISVRGKNNGTWQPWRFVYDSGNLSLSTLGYTGATNANYITNNNQLTNGAGYTTFTANQALNTNSSVTHQDVYATSWLRNNSSGTGLYNQATANHWYSDGENWNVGYNGAAFGIRLRNNHAGPISGTLYGESNGSFGLLDNDNQWAVRIQTSNNPLQLRCNNNVEFEVYDSYTHSPGSSRAPIFYDSNDTSKFVDPSGGQLRFTSAAWSGEFAGKIQYHSTHWYLQAAGHVRFRNASGANTFYVDQSGTGVIANYLTGNDSLRAPIFYDSDNTGYYQNPASTSHLHTITSANGITFTDNYGVGVTGLYNSTRIQTIFNMGAAYKLPNDGNSTANAYGLYWSHQNAGATGGANNLASHGLIILEAGNYKGSWGGGRIVTTESVRAPIFYDSNNTGYYLDPNGTSNLSTVNIAAGTFNGTLNGNASTVSDGMYLSAAQTVTGVKIFNANRNTTSSNPPLQAYGTNSGAIMSFHRGGYYAVNFGLDSDNVMRVGGWSAPQNLWQLDMSGHNTVLGSSRAPIFYDSNNTGYYTNPASTSNLNQIDTVITNATTVNATTVNANTAQVTNYNVNAGDGNGLRFWSSNSYKISMGNTSEYHYGPVTDYSIRTHMSSNAGRGFTWGIVGSAPTAGLSNTGYFQIAGTMTASNFILSSDERKKTKIKDLSCDNIDTNWKSFEMKNNEGEYRVGVIAQELEIKHPEFVNTDNEGFKSVKYIDLLIAKIAELEARLEKAGI